MESDPLKVYECHRILQEDLNKGRIVRDDLQEVLRQLGKTDKEVEVMLRGSCLSGIGIRNADVDLTLIPHSCGFGFSLQSVVRGITSNGKFTLIENVSGARIPILILRHNPTGCQVVVSYNGSDSVAAAHLLRALADINPLLEPMIIYLKVWAKQEGLINPKDHYFSGFVFTLMAIFHQQRRAGMPAISLSRGAWFEEDIQRLAATKPRMNVELSSANLRAQLRDFFEFFANFNYRRVMNTRDGCEEIRPYGWSKYDVAIAHPVDEISRFNCAAFIYGSQLALAKGAFRRAASQL